MQNWKKTAGVLLAFTLTASLLAGCSGGKTDSSSSGAASSSPASSQVSSQASSSSDDSSAVSSSTGSTPGYDYSANLTEDGFFKGVKALDYVKLPDYKGMEIPAETLEITEEELQDEMDGLAEQYASTVQVKDRAVEDKDTVNIDYVGSVDGVEFSGGNTNGAGTTVTIGVTSYIDDFLEQLIGHKPGETFDVNVTFPDPYPNNTDLSGKDAVFVTTINYIEEKSEIQWTDEFVSEHWADSEGWSAVAEMKDGLLARMKRDAAWEYLWGQITEQAEVSEVPDAIWDHYEESLVYYCQTMAKQNGQELEEFLSQNANVESMEEFLEQNKSSIEGSAKRSLLLQALCEDSGFTVSEEELDAYMQDVAGAADYSSLESFYGKPYLYLTAREDMIQDTLGEARAKN